MTFSRFISFVATPAAVLAAFQVTAMAGHDAGRDIEFKGFSRDGNRYLLLIRDRNVGDFVSVRSFSTGKQLKAREVGDPQDLKKTIQAVSRQSRIEDPGQESTSSPDGIHTLLGVQKGRKFLLKVMRGEKFADLRSFTLDRPGSSGTSMRLKTAFWSRDGRRVVIILRRASPSGVESDRAVPMRFFGGSLNFR